MPAKPRIIPDVILIVGAHDDVVHIANEARHRDQRHMHDDERQRS